VIGSPAAQLAVATGAGLAGVVPVASLLTKCGQGSAPPLVAVTQPGYDMCST
jgi:hypothetical protein